MSKSDEPCGSHACTGQAVSAWTACAPTSHRNVQDIKTSRHLRRFFSGSNVCNHYPVEFRAVESTKGACSMLFSSKAAASVLDMLKEDHRKVEALFDEFEGARDARTKQRIVDTVLQELEV